MNSIWQVLLYKFNEDCLPKCNFTLNGTLAVKMTAINFLAACSFLTPSQFQAIHAVYIECVVL